MSAQRPPFWHGLLLQHPPTHSVANSSKQRAAVGSANALLPSKRLRLHEAKKSHEASPVLPMSLVLRPRRLLLMVGLLLLMVGLLLGTSRP